ncbi:Hint domain-containing protein [Acetobacter senegalensis]|uniref:Hint domain-containing protein n=1 Tax=Acetobacter senegalensis TaxID=446692 RepID=UPI0020A21C95|nr:Hint domain-containing protein [Acetobacter senegalensis]MCP1196121.1 Hint domain-containing protein [Acetobacter senegalensis]
MTTYDWVSGNGNFNNPSMWKDSSSGTIASYDPNGQNPVVINTDSNITIDTTPYTYSDQWNNVYPDATTTPESVTFEGTGTVTVTGSGGITSYGTITLGTDQTVILDGTQMSASKTVSGGTIKLENAANLSVNTSLDTTVIDFGGNSTGSGHNTVTLGSGSYSISKITNFSPDDSIVIKNQYGYTNVEWIKTGTNTYSLVGVDQYGNTSSSAGTNYIVKDVSFAQKTTDSSGNPVYYTPSDLYGGAPASGTISGGDFDGDTYYLGNGLSSTDDNTMVITCFLAGSMIRTANGDVVVEDITIGDQVVAFDWKNNRNILRSVVWVGTARAVVRPHLADDEAGWPVRVLKDAIADGVPYKDMLITAEHCLFFEDRFVPVRMLVNGRTIFYDKSILSYDYYHVETELHSVITADGMLTESYLDTGNRSSFRQDGKVATLRGTARSWQDDAGAPLCVDRSFVQPLFHVLEHREKSVTQSLPAPEKAALVHDANLHLVTDKGATLRPVRCRDEQYSFMLPSGTQSVRILSRASRPTDVIGPFVDDRRQMGVAVGEVSLVTAKGQQTVTTHLQENKPEGWHADMGWNGVAWTNGNALLPLDALQVEGDMALLSLTIRAAGPYLAADTTKQAVQAISIA